MSGSTHSDAVPVDTAPDATARLAANTMWATDFASKALEMDILEVGPGTAVVAMVVRQDMTNGFGMAHGGFIFTLADSAFGYACNSYGLRTVAAHGSISFLAAAKTGDRLIARAREISRTGRSGLYDIQVSTEGRVIAEFRGTSRTIGGSFIDGASA